MQPYEQYNRTNQLWLPIIPLHWSIKKIKHLFSERIEKGYPNEPLLVSSQNMGVVPKTVYGNRTVEAQKDLHLLKLVRKGDFVISLRAFQGGIEYAYYQGIISPAYTIMVNNGEITSSYFKYLAKSAHFIDLLRLCVTGIREGQNIDYQKLKNYKIPVPPRDEQEQIVRFLDWKVSAINRLINLRRKEITALEDLKRSIIYHAVTHGIKPNVPMKDSGVQWIGKIPNHWKLLRNKNIFCEAKELVGTHSDKYPLLSLTTKGIILRDVESGKGKFPKDFETYKIVSKGDMAFCLFDIDETPRTVGLSSYDGMLTGAYSIFHVSNVNPRYVYYYYLSVDDVKSLRPLYSGLRKTINTNTFLGIKFPYPPQDEQEQIVQFLEQKTVKVNEAVKNKEQQLDGLNDLKARLISDVVTGKIDVRGVEVPEYEYVDETPETEDSEIAEDEEQEADV